MMARPLLPHYPTPERPDGGLGIPVAAWLVMPLLRVAVLAAEVTVALAVIFTALYGSERLSDRAFRLLRWSLNRPEP